MENTRRRTLSVDNGVIGRFETVDQVGEHLACAVDPSQEFLKTLKQGSAHVSLSPISSPISEEEDVKSTQEPGVGPPLFSADMSKVTMSKGDATR